MAQTKLTWTDVGSSNVQSVTYHPESRTLGVLFTNGGLYSYDGVEEDVYVSMVHAESVGRYLNQMVKGRYAYLRWFSEQELLAHMLTTKR